MEEENNQVELCGDVIRHINTFLEKGDTLAVAKVNEAWNKALANEVCIILVCGCYRMKITQGHGCVGRRVANLQARKPQKTMVH